MVPSGRHRESRRDVRKLRWRKPVELLHFSEAQDCAAVGEAGFSPRPRALRRAGRAPALATLTACRVEGRAQRCHRCGRGGNAGAGKSRPPSLPDAAPRFDRPRCGGRESKFLGGATFRPGRSEVVQNLKREAEGEVKRAEVFAGATVGVHAVVEAEGADGKFVAEAEAEAVAEGAGVGYVAI